MKVLREASRTAHADKTPAQLIEHRCGCCYRVELQLSKKSVHSFRATIDKLQFSFQLPSVAYVPSDPDRLRAGATKYGGGKVELSRQATRSLVTQKIDRRVGHKNEVHAFRLGVMNMGGKHAGVFVPVRSHPFGNALSKPLAGLLPFGWLHVPIWVHKLSETRKFPRLRDRGKIYPLYRKNLSQDTQVVHLGFVTVIHLSLAPFCV